MMTQKKTCQSYDNGGLGLISLVRLNEATNIKLGWDMMNNIESWDTLLKNRIMRTNDVIKYHIFSTIWTGIKA